MAQKPGHNYRVTDDGESYTTDISNNRNHEKCMVQSRHKMDTKSRLIRTLLLLTRDIDIAILSVRLSVCPSVTRWYRHSFFHHTVAQSFQFYQQQTSSRNFDGVTPAGALNTGGV